MVGKYYLRVDSGNLEYNMEFKRGITILKGDSGVGKSTLIQLLISYLRRSVVFVDVQTNARGILVLDESTDWKSVLQDNEGYLIFADEQVPYITSKSFSIALQKSRNYFIFITRDKRLMNLSYSVDEIYSFKADMDGEHIVNSMYKLYSDYIESVKPDIIITEDSRSGHDLIEHMFGDLFEVISAFGKDNIYNYIVDNVDDSKCVYVVVDGAAFGSRISELIGLTSFMDIHIFAPESFEYLLLCVSIFRGLTHGELTETYNYAHSSKYVTWESYFEELLRDLCRSLGTRYKKDRWDKLSYIFKQDSFLKELKSEFKDSIGGI